MGHGYLHSQTGCLEVISAVIISQRLCHLQPALCHIMEDTQHKELFLLIDDFLDICTCTHSNVYQQQEPINLSES